MQAETQNELSVGEVFAYDLVDADGLLVLSAGTPVSEEFLATVVSTGLEVLYVASDLPAPEPYSAQTVQQVATFFEDTPSIVADLSNMILNGGTVSQEEIDATIDQCIDAIGEDTSVVLATAIGLESASERAGKNVRLSSLAMIAAQEMGYSGELCKAVGRAGLLCDVSISQDDLALDDIPPDTSQYDRALALYLQHPTRSAEMLRQSVPGISELELVLVTQVHEQSDGSGFPRGLKKHHLHPLGRLLNMIDAFLTLTDPTTPSGRIVPADALAYIVLHSLYGVFDRDCIQALVKAAAIYPIGTEVILNDDTTGVVMRSGDRDYMEPVVQIRGTKEIIDLRASQRIIVGPNADGSLWQRLQKSQLSQTLWNKAA